MEKTAKIIERLCSDHPLDTFWDPETLLIAPDIRVNVSGLAMEAFLQAIGKYAAKLKAKAFTAESEINDAQAVLDLRLLMDIILSVQVAGIAQHSSYPLTDSCIGDTQAMIAELKDVAARAAKMLT